MTINTTPKEKPAGDCNPTAGTINDLDFPTGQRPRKAFETLRAAFAIQGHALHRTDPTDGPVAYWVERWGMVRNLSTLDDALEFLKQIGGRA
ncbi:hypothetical protein [Aquabacterium sp. A08]|uniref:hypothetical protein n=1 Tax=Aquabacterium sp. A08 TaxID=2718532 RepID=UPI00141E8400|nr:hypothetical protein [Aquabacterium sp. A08]NIC41841.1 hypothetical protein [Aquabacterium sp. A08]